MHVKEFRLVLSKGQEEGDLPPSIDGFFANQFRVERSICVIIMLCQATRQTDPHCRCLDKEEKEQVVQLRSRGNACLCSLRKENLSSWKDPETEHARQVFVSPGGSEGGGEWRPLTKLPFATDKWCLTAVVLYNYLYVIGGYRERVKKGWEFRMASFRFNPQTVTWATTAPLIKVRRPPASSAARLTPA